MVNTSRGLVVHGCISFVFVVKKQQCFVFTNVRGDGSRWFFGRGWFLLNF